MSCKCKKHAWKHHSFPCPACVVDAPPGPATVWKPVVGYEGYYDVSSTGLIRRLRFTNNVVDRLYDEPRILKPRYNNKGYRGAYLRRGGKARNASVHTLIAEAFLGPRPKGMMVGHLDGNHLNNHWRNLAYITPAENSRQRIYHAKNRDLQDKLARLTAALEKIATGEGISNPEDCPEVAREALGEAGK